MKNTTSDHRHAICASTQHESIGEHLFSPGISVLTPWTELSIILDVIVIITDQQVFAAIVISAVFLLFFFSIHVCVIFVLSVPLSLLFLLPRSPFSAWWGTADEEIKSPLLRIHQMFYLFLTWSRSEYSPYCFSHRQEFCPFSFLPFWFNELRLLSILFKNNVTSVLNIESDFNT